MNTPRINVTPLIDVLLVLLIIFMVVTPIKPSRFEARIPSEPTTPADTSNPLSLLVTLGGSGSLSINREIIGSSVDDTAALSDRLRETFAARKTNGSLSTDGTHVETTVFIKTPRNSGYGSVAKIVDAVKVAGADPISLEIDDLDR